LGVIDIYGKTSQETTALDVFAGVDVSDVFYNVAASEDF
jgi:hypothetical protein